MSHGALPHAQQLLGPQATSLFANVPMSKRCNHWIEWSGSGILLDIASAALSLLTVMTYMVSCMHDFKQNIETEV